ATEAQQLAQLHAQSAEVAEAIDLAQDFTALVRQRQPECLDAWLTRATASTLEAFQRFARGLHEDYKASKAGVTLPWSTSPVDVPLDRAGTPGQGHPGFASLIVLVEPARKALEGLQCTGRRAREPGIEALRLPLADEGGKVLREVNRL